MPLSKGKYHSLENPFQTSNKYEPPNDYLKEIREISLELNSMLTTYVNEVLSFRPQLCQEVPLRDIERVKGYIMEATGCESKNSNLTYYYLPINLSDKIQEINPSIPEYFKKDVDTNDTVKNVYKNRIITAIDNENLFKLIYACGFVSYTVINSYLQLETDNTISEKNNKHSRSNILNGFTKQQISDLKTKKKKLHKKIKPDLKTTSSDDANIEIPEIDGLAVDDDDDDEEEEDDDDGEFGEEEEDEEAMIKPKRASDNYDAYGGIKKSVKKGFVPGFRELAYLIGFTPWHFHRLFKNVVGVTTKEYAQLCIHFIKSNDSLVTDYKLRIDEVKKKYSGLIFETIMFYPIEKVNRATLATIVDYYQNDLQNYNRRCIEAVGTDNLENTKMINYQKNGIFIDHRSEYFFDYYKTLEQKKSKQSQKGNKEKSRQNAKNNNKVRKQRSDLIRLRIDKAAILLKNLSFLYDQQKRLSSTILEQSGNSINLSTSLEKELNSIAEKVIYSDTASSVSEESVIEPKNEYVFPRKNSEESFIEESIEKAVEVIPFNNNDNMQTSPSSYEEFAADWFDTTLDYSEPKQINTSYCNFIVGSANPSTSTYKLLVENQFKSTNKSNSAVNIVNSELPPSVLMSDQSYSNLSQAYDSSIHRDPTGLIPESITTSPKTNKFDMNMIDSQLYNTNEMLSSFVSQEQ